MLKQEYIYIRKAIANVRKPGLFIALGRCMDYRIMEMLEQAYTTYIYKYVHIYVHNTGHSILILE